MRDSGPIDVSQVFSEALAQLMTEMGMTRDRYTDDEIVRIVRSCVSEEYANVWDEFIDWVLYGDDRKAKTKAMIRMGRSAWRS